MISPLRMDAILSGTENTPLVLNTLARQTVLKALVRLPSSFLYAYEGAHGSRSKSYLVSALRSSNGPDGLTDYMYRKCLPHARLALTVDDVEAFVWAIVPWWLRDIAPFHVFNVMRWDMLTEPDWSTMRLFADSRPIPVSKTIRRLMQGKPPSLDDAGFLLLPEEVSLVHTACTRAGLLHVKRFLREFGEEQSCAVHLSSQVPKGVKVTFHPMYAGRWACYVPEDCWTLLEQALSHVALPKTTSSNDAIVRRVTTVCQRVERTAMEYFGHARRDGEARIEKATTETLRFIKDAAEKRGVIAASANQLAEGNASKVEIRTEANKAAAMALVNFGEWIIEHWPFAAATGVAIGTAVLSQHAVLAIPVWVAAFIAFVLLQTWLE